MHFWIDKRSQTCGFGRARVAASLGTGGMGLGFGTPPRRMISKPSAAIIHRQQQQHQQSQGDSSSRSHSTGTSNHNSSSSNSHNTPIVTNSSNTNNNNNPNTRNNRSRSNHSNGSSPYQLHRQQQQSHHHSYESAQQAARHYSAAQQQQQQQQQQHQQHLQQPPIQQHHSQHQRHHHSSPANHHSPHNIPRTTAQLLTVNNQDYHIPVALPYNYGGPSNSIELEQGSMGIETLAMRTANMSSANHQLGPTSSDASHHVLAEVSGDVQLLPAHLKFGMCASLVLASVFIAGAKYYFDHQGGGMDALIFCAFLTISFLALCAISLCRYVPRDMTASPSISVDGHSRMLDVQHRGPDTGSGQHHSGSPHPQIYAQNVDHTGQDIQINAHSPAANSIAAPPPPYHIAILLPPESGKEIQLDESPPPSYDKILI